MTTDQLTGRALDEAAARAMGWITSKWDAWCDADGYWRVEADGPRPNEREMWAHLTKHGKHGSQLIVSAITGEVIEKMGHTLFYGTSKFTAFGTGLREALERLVVAVAAREANDGK